MTEQVETGVPHRFRASPPNEKTPLNGQGLTVSYFGEGRALPLADDDADALMRERAILPSLEAPAALL